MRILLTADPFLPVPPKLYGGIERVIASLATGLRARGHEVALLAHRDSTLDDVERFAWRHSEPAGYLQHARNAKCLRAAVRQFQPAVVHSFSRLAYIGPILRKRIGKVMSFQRNPTGRTVRWAALLGGRSLAFTGCSDYIARLGAKAGGHWSAIPNFVDPATFPASDSVPGEAPLLFLSRLERIKGAHRAIAMARLAGRRLVIAGNRAESGEEARYFEQEIQPHIDGDRVAYVGPVDDVEKSRLLRASAAMVVPIEWDEPFGIVFAEALASGTPVITRARGAAPEIVREGVTGFIVDSDEDGAAAIGRLEAIDRRDCARDARERYSIDAVVPMYEDLYAKMAGAR